MKIHSNQRSIPTVFLDDHYVMMTMTILDVTMLNYHVVLHVLPKTNPMPSKSVHCIRRTFRVDRPLETVSLVLIRFEDRLDGETSIIPDVLLCSLS